MHGQNNKKTLFLEQNASHLPDTRNRRNTEIQRRLAHSVVSEAQTHHSNCEKCRFQLGTTILAAGLICAHSRPCLYRIPSCIAIEII